MPGRDLKSIHQTVKQIIDRQEVKRPTRATVYAIDGKRIDVYVPGSPSVMKHIEVVGEIERIRVGDSVALRWEHDRPQAMIVAEAGTDPGDFRNSVPVDGITIKWGDNGLEIAQQAIGLGHLTFDPLLGGNEYSSQVFTSRAPQLKGDYVWRGGKVGGQDIYGGTATGQHLNFYANAALDGTGNIIMFSSPHVLLGTAGVTPVEGFTIENDSDVYFAIHTGTTKVGRIQWGSSDDANAGQLIYSHSTDTFSWINTDTRVITFSLTEFVINNGQIDFDFRVESDSDDYAFFVRGSDSFVGIGVSDPQRNLHVNGPVRLNQYVELGELDTDEEPTAVASFGQLIASSNEQLVYQTTTKRYELLGYHLPFTTYGVLPQGITSDQTVFSVTISESVTILSWHQAAFCTSLNDSDNYWEISLRRNDGALIKLLDTSGIGVTTWAVLSDTALSYAIAESDIGAYVEVEEVGTPGNIYLHGPMVFVK